MMKVEIAIRTADWKLAVANDARLTQGLEEGKPLNLMLWREMLHAEHTPIRSLEFEITFIDIPYWVTAHLDRHHVGVQPFQRTQRSDAMNPVSYDRRKAPQDAPVTFRMVCNTQALINISRKRLCRLAAHETQDAWSLVYYWFLNNPDLYLTEIALVMYPDCQYRGGYCHEPKKRSCGLMPHWTEGKWG